MKLDVGSGNRPRGDLNVDVSIPCNVKASILKLPFRNKTFKESTCFHLLEHLTEPYRGLNELLRVTQHKIKVQVPLGLKEKIELYLIPGTENGHKHFFNLRSFQELIGFPVTYRFKLITWLMSEKRKPSGDLKNILLELINPLPSELRAEINVIN